MATFRLVECCVHMGAVCISPVNWLHMEICFKIKLLCIRDIKCEGFTLFAVIYVTLYGEIVAL